MIFFTGTVSLIQLDNLYLAVSLADTLMIGQSSEVIVSEGSGPNIGRFEYADSSLPAYYLNDKLFSSADSVLLKESQFCIGLRTSQEADYFVLLCKQFEQINLSDHIHTMQELPGFMCNEKMLVEGMLAYQNQVYLMTSADKVLDYIVSNDTDNTQEKNDA